MRSRSRTIARRTLVGKSTAHDLETVVARYAQHQYLSPRGRDIAVGDPEVSSLFLLCRLVPTLCRGTAG